MMNAFYHHIQKLCIQCQFSDDEECLDQLIHLIRWSHVVIVVQLIPKTDAQFIDQLASIVTDWVIFHLCAGLLITVLVLFKTPGSSTGFVVEAEHPKVEVLQEDR